MSIQELWTPAPAFTSQSNLGRYAAWVSETYGLDVDSYETLRQWSVADIDRFWESIWDYFKVIDHAAYSEVRRPSADGFIGTQWFPGSKLNYAEHIFRMKQADHPAILFKSERKPLTAVSWQELEEHVAALSTWLRAKGVRPGDRVAAFLPNIPEAIIGFLASNAVGATWSSCSPDFGAASVIERFQQIEPKVLLIADGYSYNGKGFQRKEANSAICNSLDSLEQVIAIDYLASDPASFDFTACTAWNDILETPHGELTFEPVDFDHPLWVLYSSGTTGKPKAITHSNGGNLLEHLKALSLHQDCKPGDHFFWYSTTGWMMWNYALASMLCGSTVCIYDGSAAWPDINALWDFAREAEIDHFGAGASFYIACMKQGVDLTTGTKQLPRLRSVGSTGSPLPPEAFQWVYDSIGQDIWLISLSGGTDVCSGFVGGNTFNPVYKGEIQCRLLGCDLQSWDEAGNSVTGQVGEMIIAQPMPSMPVFFWGDNNNERYRASYFEMYPDVWRHGDWIEITERNTLIIYGRSDATLNRGGVRIGTSEIYSGVDSLEEISDSLVVCLDYEDGSHYMPLFVVLRPGVDLDDTLRKKIASTLRNRFSPRHVPDVVIPVGQIPYTISGKKMESPVKKILAGMDITGSVSRDAMKNPEALDAFIAMGKLEP